jgi:hypothetical protein
MARQECDAVEAQELALYAVNTGDLYRQRAQPIIANLARKIVAGKYDAALALKAWRYLADDAAQRYRREFSMVGGFSPATRDAASAEIAQRYAEELEHAANLERVWRNTHSDYRGSINGTRNVLVLREGGTTLVPLDCLTCEEIARMLPKSAA